MENGNLFSCQANGYAISEVDEYLRIFYNEYRNTVAWGQELEERYICADKAKKDLQEEFLAVKKSKDELYDNCVKLSNALNAGAAAVSPVSGEQAQSTAEEALSPDAQARADEIIKSAEVSAVAIISDAQAKASKAVSDAQLMAERMISEAESKSSEMLSCARDEVSKLRFEAAQKAEQLAQIIGSLGKFGL